MSEILIQQSARHSVFVQSFAGHLANLFDPYLKRLVRELKIIMIDAPVTTKSIRRINQIVGEWRRASLSVYGEYNDDVLFKELEPFSFGESQWELKSLKSVVKAPGLSLAAPAAQQVWAGVLSDPLVFPDSRGVKLLNPFVKDWEDGQIRKVGDIIRTGYVTGRTNEQIVKDIVDQNTGILGSKTKGGTRASIKSMVRTSTNHTSNIAREQTRKANDDIVIGYLIISTLDSKTSDFCSGVDGTKVFNAGFIIWGSTGIKEVTTFRPMPAFHPNCVLGETNITTCSGVNTLYKRTYKGAIVDIATKSGRTLSITPNHPILTRDGWKAAKLINSSDQLATIPDEILIGKDYENSVKSTASDLFCAANVSVKSVFITNRPATTEHFHGDGTNGEVSVISMDSLSWDGVKSIINKKFIYDWLVKGELIYSAFDCFRFFNKRFNFNFTPPHSIISSFSVCALFLKRHIIHPYLLLLGWVSECAKFFPKQSFNRVFRAVQAEVLGDSPDSYSGFISFDDVVSVNSRKLDKCTHVYNLENKDNWYLSNGIITHNCRTSTSSILDPAFDVDDSGTTRASKGVSGGKQVDAGSTYYGWLKAQGNQGKAGRAFVQDRLGVERGNLLIDGGLSAEKFSKLTLDEVFQPIPLKELRKKESLSLAFDKID